MLVFLSGGGWLGRGGIIAEDVAHLRHAAAAREQKREENGEQISALPPKRRLRYTQFIHFATPTVFHEATDTNPPPTL